ncbi:PPK2 family polyphosphate kinase [Allohahella marinimesophila]
MSGRIILLLTKIIRQDAGTTTESAAVMAFTLIDPITNPFLLPFDGRLSMRALSTSPVDKDGALPKDELKERLQVQVEALHDLQRKLFADKRFSVLLIFQALDAAGKDSTIRHVMTGVNPAGVSETSFGRPTSTELDQDFLWRAVAALPAKGKIGIFNRSYYEEVLTVRVNQELLLPQRVPGVSEHPDGTVEVDVQFWEDRFTAIAAHEQYLARQGVLVLKFFLNVSREEQKQRLLSRIDKARKNWKFEAGDLDTRDQWPAYEAAYEDVFSRTAKPWAPWYAIPADSKPYMRLKVAETIVAAMERLNPSWPELDDVEKAGLEAARTRLTSED